MDSGSAGRADGALRIALVSLHTSPIAEPGSGDVGGMNVVVRQTAGQLARLGHRVEIFTRRIDERVCDIDTIPGVPVRFLEAGPVRPLTKAEQAPLIPEFGERLAPFASGWDVVHSHHWLSGEAALPVAARAGVPHVQSFHSIAGPAGTGLDRGERAERAERLAAEPRLAARSAAVIAISRFEAAEVVTRLGADPGRVDVCLPGVDAEVFAPRASRRRPGARPLLLVASRLEPLKGVDLALAALAQLNRRPGGIRPVLVVAGGPTAGFEDYPEELRRLAVQLGVAGDVRWEGACTRARLASLMATADVMLVPSHSETYGLVALEAQACGTPVVASKTGGLTESVVDGVTGRLLGSRDPVAWARAIAAALQDPERMRKLSRAAWQHASERTWTATAAGWADGYRRVIGEGGRRR